MSRYFLGTGGRTRTYEPKKGEIYSLLSLPLDDSGADIVFHTFINEHSLTNRGAASRIRTVDLLFTKQLL